MHYCSEREKAIWEGLNLDLDGGDFLGDLACYRIRLNEDLYAVAGPTVTPLDCSWSSASTPKFNYDWLSTFAVLPEVDELCKLYNFVKIVGMDITYVRGVTDSNSDISTTSVIDYPTCTIFPGMLASLDQYYAARLGGGLKFSVLDSSCPSKFFRFPTVYPFPIQYPDNGKWNFVIGDVWNCCSSPGLPNTNALYVNMGTMTGGSISAGLLLGYDIRCGSVIMDIYTVWGSSCKK